jgi:hypothetical protein
MLSFACLQAHNKPIRNPPLKAFGGVERRHVGNTQAGVNGEHDEILYIFPGPLAMTFALERLPFS